MIKKTKIGCCNIKFVFRHRFEKNQPIFSGEFRKNDFELGIFAKKIEVVGVKDFNKPKLWSKNLVDVFIIGLELILCKFWIEVSFKPIMTFNENV